MFLRSTLTIALATLALTTLTGQSVPQASSTLIMAARLLDVSAGVYRANYAVLVSGERISAVGPLADIQRRTPADAQTIDLGSATLLPGLIDAHAHVLSSMDGRRDAGSNILAAITQLGLPRRVLLGVAHARELLDAGFTTVRNLGHSGIDGDVALRDAINAGSVPGPRILAAGRKITPPGGQGLTIRSPDADTIVRQEFLPISGVLDAQRAVGELLTAGVDVVKIVVDDDNRVLDRDDVAAIVRTAHRAGLRVAAHATSPGGIQAAIDGGVDSIEHGDGATEAMLKAMRDKGIALGVTVWTAEALRDVFMSERVMTNAERAGGEQEIHDFTGRMAGLVQRATKAGVRIAAGSDMWMRYPGKTRGQATKLMFQALARSGLSNAAVIRATTVDAAEVLGWTDRVGSLDAGRFADVIAVPGDPLADVAALETVSFVMKGGSVVLRSR